MHSDDRYRPNSSNLTLGDLNIENATNLEAAESHFLSEVTQTPEFLGKGEELGNSAQFEQLVKLFDTKPNWVEEPMDHHTLQKQSSVPLSTPQMIEALNPFNFPCSATPKTDSKKEDEIACIHSFLTADVQKYDQDNSGLSNPNGNSYIYLTTPQWVDEKPTRSDYAVSQPPYYETVGICSPSRPVSAELDRRSQSSDRGTPFSTSDCDTIVSDPEKYCGRQTRKTSAQSSLYDATSEEISRIRPYSRKTPAEKGSLAYLIKRERNNVAVKKARAKTREKLISQSQEFEELQARYEELVAAHNNLLTRHESAKSKTCNGCKRFF